ncbi:MAG: DNA polymerase III subunit gamma/tau [Pseudomonadota bacterium]
MSYQVLARKWRPTTFDTLVGQEHVLQALRHALDSDRLHHAYLFTGTRGVGKTTIARILARALNCEKGVSSTPCGVCGSCVEIDEGRSVDLIEVDAASRTKVEDTRELLDNVQYAPTRSRFKIYLIDEVHMLSGHSFNALLKTLEEPPEHVKFLLATTDPQKLPATVLSRCLQFNLKNMSAGRVVEHLRHVLTEEGVSFEDGALWLLGRGAAGSMRDALSLTDQAIAFCSGSLREADVASMLGTVDRSYVYTLIDRLIAEDAPGLLQECAQLGERGIDFLALADECASVLHRVAVAQAVPNLVDPEQGDEERVKSLASSMTAEDVQLFYQLLQDGRGHLAVAGDPKAAFEMLMLRLIAFRPVAALDPALSPDDIGELSAQAAPGVGEDAKKPEPPSAASGAVSGVVTSETPSVSAPPASAARTSEAEKLSSAPSKVDPTDTHGLQAPVDRLGRSHQPEATARESLPEPVGVSTFSEEPAAKLEVTDSRQGAPLDHSDPVKLNGQSLAASSKPSGAESSQPSTEPAPTRPGDVQWHDVVEQLSLSGSVLNIASHCALEQRDGSSWRLILDEKRSNLFNERHEKAIENAIANWSGGEVQVQITVGAVQTETPALRRERLATERVEAARRLIREDPRVQQLLTEFDGHMLDDSVRVET